MLAKENYTKENIQRLRDISGNDPSLLEKTVYAFGLLEAIAKVGMPFIFKGGTCLMLLLDKPRRLSTDIDIIVEPGTNVDMFIEKAGQLFPFVNQQEDIRKGKNNIEKRHYEFTYNSPINNKPLVILLYILFEHNNYSNIIEKPIRNDILINEGEDINVKLPDIDSILGDKLTAFAPHTTGVRFGEDKELEIIKQLFDCYTLSEEMKDYKKVVEVYNKIALVELNYRGMSCEVKDVLKDTIKSCLCIISKGGIIKSEYNYYIDGIRRIAGHIYNENFNGEKASFIACKVLYLVSCIYTESDYIIIKDWDTFKNKKLSFKGARSVNYIKKVNMESYAYLCSTINLLGDEIEEIVEC